MLTFQAYYLIVQKSFWSIFDQAIFAISNFAINLILIGWISSKDYGIFITLYSLFLLFLTVENALFIEPMLVFGAAEYKADFPGYFGRVLILHVIFQATLATVLILFAFLGNQFNFNFGPQLLILALAQPFMMTMWFVRRASYVNLLPRSSAIAGVFNLIITLGLLIAFHSMDKLNLMTIYLTIALPNLIVSIFLILHYKARLEWRRELLNAVWAKHSHFGKWLVLSGFFSWVPRNIYYSLLLLWMPSNGLDMSASLKTHSLFVEPLVQGFTAIGIMVIPLFANSSSHKVMNQRLRFVWIAGYLLSAVYLLGMFILADDVAQFLSIDGFSMTLLIGFSALPFLTLSVNLLGAVFRSYQNTFTISAAFVIGVLITITFGFLLTWKLGLSGAVSGILISYLCISIFLFFRFIRMGRSGQMFHPNGDLVK
jgi:O-antigen/teichoic acid export membrane protein